MRKLALLMGLAIILSVPASSWAHCEIPCGIYDDSTRYVLLEEHITTIEKAMKRVEALSNKEDQNYNQLVRWIMNKEEHAVKFMDIVTQYFLTQRVKPKDGDFAKRERYIKLLTGFHEMLIYAMKCKQSTELEHVDKLRDLVKESRETYFAK